MVRLLAYTPAWKWWRTAQWTALAATVLLIVALIVQPAMGLFILWNVLIPLVPASLLLNPLIWRNVCPLATLNLITNSSKMQRRLTARWIPLATVAGIFLLVALVPARRFLFNQNGIALALTVIAVGGIAVAAGALAQVKAGFCNALCPVLPVERLYGQHPIIDVGNARCSPCTACTAGGCVDVNPAKSVSAGLGRSMTTDAWLKKPLGIFVAAFPGFVIGYYTTPDGPLASAAFVYGWILLWSLASYVVTLALVELFLLEAAQITTLLAAAAAGLYYWFASRAIPTAFGLPAAAITTMRIVTLSFIALWLWRGLGAIASQSRRVAR